MALDKIRRPDNVHVPRSVERRIQARRALVDGSPDTMRTTLDELGVKVGSKATKAELQRQLHMVAGGGNLIGSSTAPAAAVSAPTAEVRDGS